MPPLKLKLANAVFFLAIWVWALAPSMQVICNIVVASFTRSIFDSIAYGFLLFELQIISKNNLIGSIRKNPFEK